MTEDGITQAVQDYLKTVYRLSQTGKPAGTSMIAEELAVAPASVTGMLKRLSKDGFVHYTPRYGAELTAKGLAVALEIIRHHRLLESFFVERLGMSWAQAHQEAEVLEHHISEELENVLDELMGFPKSDPQGAPIPTRDGEVHTENWPALAKAQTGMRYVVRRVRHRDPALMHYVEQLGLGPGTQLDVLEVRPFGDPIKVRVHDQEMHLGAKVAGAILVEPVLEESPEPDATGRQVP